MNDETDPQRQVREHLADLAAAATDAPWFYFDRAVSAAPTDGNNPRIVASVADRSDNPMPDVHFIIACREAVPALLAELVTAEAERDEAKAFVGRLLLRLDELTAPAPPSVEDAP